MAEVTINNIKYEIDDDLYRFALHPEVLRGISPEDAHNILARAIGCNILITNSVIEKLYAAKHEGRESELILNYQTRGAFKQIPSVPDEKTCEQLKTLFQADDRFHGRFPQILKSIARISDFYTKNHAHDKEEYQDRLNEKLVSRFSISAVRGMLSNKTPQAIAVMLYERYTPEKCVRISENQDNMNYICSLLIKAHRKDKDTQTSKIFYDAADWISEHLDSGRDIKEKIAKSADILDIKPEDTVGAVQAKIFRSKSMKAVKKLEKAYKEAHFKLKNCTCELKGVGVEVENGRYKAYIMKPDDERQVSLGDDTTCCQRLYDIGESAMMHGLLHPKAGFWALEEKSTGLIKAQAEIWEENENTLVFDNIEFANDADIELYKDCIGDWLRQTEYANVKMGVGYNQMSNVGDFRDAPAAKPPVTPYEIYVISHENESEAPIFDSEQEAKEALDSGRVTYFDYVYCDAENRCLHLKEGGVLEPFFMTEAELAQKQAEQEEGQRQQRSTISRIMAVDAPDAVKSFLAVSNGLDAGHLRQILRPAVMQRPVVIGQEHEYEEEELEF